MKTRNGLTLTELLVTLAIVGVLLTTSLRVAVALSRSTSVVRQQEGISSLQTGLENLLSTDLAHASSLEKTADGFVLTSRAYLDSKDFSLRHLPCRVSYRTETIGSRTWLVRMQSRSGWTARDLVCSGVSEILVRSLSNPSTERVRSDTLPNMLRRAVIEFILNDPQAQKLRFEYRVR